MKDKCRFRGCDGGAVTKGWCVAHHRAVLRHGVRGLKPIARRGPVREPVTLMVAHELVRAIEKDRAGAREALERWCERQRVA